VISSPRQYVCVLRWKAGERAALLCTAPQFASALTPIIEPTPRAFEHAAEQADLFRSTLRETAREIGLAWARRPFFFDAQLIRAAAARLTLNPDEILVAESLAYGLRASPVLSLSTQPVVAKRIISGLSPESVVGLRVSASDLGSMIGRARVSKLLNESALQPGQIHLFVDLGVLSTDDPPTELLLGLPHLGSWRAVTLLAGSFPPHLIDLDLGIHYLPRYEWRMYRNLLQEWPNDYPVPRYGDFGTQHAEFREPQIPCHPSLSVRYACEDEWLVLRGSSYKKKDGGGSRQFIGHARFLTQHEQFSGPGFCSGDQYIYERTLPNATPGNHMTWLSASMNHHLSVTVANLARLAAQPLERAAAQDHPRLAVVLQEGVGLPTLR
jgi:hypothetical protein